MLLRCIQCREPTCPRWAYFSPSCTVFGSRHDSIARSTLMLRQVNRIAYLQQEMASPTQASTNTPTTSHQFCSNSQWKISFRDCWVAIWSNISDERRTKLTLQQDLNVYDLQQTISNCKDTKQSKYLELFSNIVFISHHGHQYCVLTK